MGTRGLVSSFMAPPLWLRRRWYRQWKLTRQQPPEPFHHLILYSMILRPSALSRNYLIAETLNHRWLEQMRLESDWRKTLCWTRYHNANSTESSSKRPINTHQSSTLYHHRSFTLKRQPRLHNSKDWFTYMEAQLERWTKHPNKSFKLSDFI